MGTKEENANVVEERLTQLWFALLNIDRRWHVVSATAQRLDGLTGGRPFVDRNDAILGLLQDSFERCIVDLASWRKAFCRFIDLHRSRIGRVRVSSPRKTARLARQSGPRDLGVMRAAARTEAFQRLFPARPRDTWEVAGAKLDTLKERATAELAGVTRRRNFPASHRYDNLADQEVEPDDLLHPAFREKLNWCKKTLRDLALCITEESLSMDVADGAEQVAEDLVDLLLYGTLEDVALRAGSVSHQDAFIKVRRQSRAQLATLVSGLAPDATVDTADVWAKE